jgi:hypothetical protein
MAVDSVLAEERNYLSEWGTGNIPLKPKEDKRSGFSHALMLWLIISYWIGMVERRMRASIKMTGDIWYSAWVDAGQPTSNH